MSTVHYDAAVVGAGIVGLAHAYHLAKRGLRVAVFERSPKAQGASVRNFGMVWPIGQTPGEMHRIALRSREIWLELLNGTDLWYEECGSLHLAYHEDEAAVLREFCNEAPARGYDVEYLQAARVASFSPAVRAEGLLGGMWSATEVCVDPREVIAGLPAVLTKRFGVTFHFNTAVSAYSSPQLIAGGREWSADRLYVCCGDDFQTLYPEAFVDSGIVRCKLQMMRTAPEPNGWRIGPMLAAGLTLRHYKAFADCPSLAAVRDRVSRENPEFDRFGIHVMASQNGRGEIVIGDSHEYESDIEPFDKEEIDAIILRYLTSFLQAPDLRIASRWHGVYAKHPDLTYFTADPAPNAHIVTSTGGAGMTLSFGIAEKTVAATLA